MKKKTTRSATTTKSAASARRPAKRPAARAATPSAARPAAKAAPISKKAAPARTKAAPAKPKAIRSAAKAARRVPKAPASPAKAAPAAAKPKVAAKKKVLRRAPVRRAPRGVAAAPAPAQTPPPAVPAAKPASPPTLSSGFTELTAPPPTLSSLVRQAQATQPLAAAPTEPVSPKPAPAPAPAQPPLPIPSILLEGDERTQPVIPGPVEKFVLGPTPPPEPPKAEVSELPEAYGTGKLYLTARDPHCLYAHWDLTEAQQRRHSGFAHHLALRLYLDNLGGERVAESPVDPAARHGFVHVGRAGVSYVAQLGCYQPGGEWLALAVSEPAATPPEAVAEDKTVRWAAVEPVVAAPAPPAPQPEMPAPAPMTPPPTTSAAPPPVARQVQAEPVRVAPAPELWQVQAPAVPAQPVAAPSLSVAVPTWSPAQERVLAEMVEIALGQPRTVGSVEMVEGAQRRVRREVLVPAQQEGASLPFGVPLPLGGPASLPVPVESEVLGISSPASGLPPGPARQFWFNVNVEVVVYGATEPTARVTLGGLPLRLRPDGTFSCRFALPDGRYDLPAVAVSVDNDTRRADLTLGRRTEYHGEVGVHPQDKALRPPAPEHVQAAQAT